MNVDQTLVQDWSTRSDVELPTDPTSVVLPRTTHRRSTKRASEDAVHATKRPRHRPASGVGVALLKAMESTPTQPTKALTRAHPLLRSLQAYVTSTPAAVDDDGEVPRRVLECVDAAYETSMLRAAGDDEISCSEGSACEGVQMATVLPRSEGFVLVAFTSPGGLRRARCLLCLRKATTMAWYDGLATQGVMRAVVQSHRVPVDAPGAYASGACLPIDPRLGVTDPFVKHERHRYEYVPGSRQLRQRGVNFRWAPPPRDTG